MTYEEKAEKVRIWLAKNNGKVKQGDLAEAINVRVCTLSSALNPARPSGVVDMAYDYIQRQEGK